MKGAIRYVKFLAATAVAGVSVLVLHPRAQAQSPATPSSASGTKNVVTGAAPLPTRAYKIPKKPSEMLADETACKALARTLEHDVRHDLQTYTIQDRRAHSGYLEYAGLAAYALGDYDTSLRYYEERKKFEDRPDDRLLSGLNVQASRAATHAPKAQQDAVYRQTWGDLLKPLPYVVVGGRIQRDRKQVADISAPVLRGFAATWLDREWKNGAVDFHVAAAIVNYYVLLHEFAPRKAAIVGPMDAYLARASAPHR